jgi:hypothetical protein
VLLNQLVVDADFRPFVVAGDDSRCVTSEPHGVGAEQRGQKTAVSGISVAHEGQVGMRQIRPYVSRGGRVAM